MGFEFKCRSDEELALMTRDEARAESKRLREYERELRSELKRIQAAQKLVPKYRGGRNGGTRTKSGDQNHLAAMKALNLYQAWANRRKRDGLKSRLPDAQKEKIIEAARAGLPLSSQEQVRKLFNDHRAYSEEKVTVRGYVHRVRGPDYL
ncbi:hypothetical protein [Bradyrhizobium sp. WSM2793]|uniref:hypothetical protein n=1 Tax=Bradyrhizobium sp. WSM2793 TaxID=1038866 RepID=UPI00037775AA|nr:hypothetical protein [Bradyrhizobium sp. WSM2793]